MTTNLKCRQNIPITKRATRTRSGPSEWEVEDLETIWGTQPVCVDGDRLEIYSNRLETGRVYPFSYLDSKMVLWKAEDGSVDIYQVIAE